MSVRCPSCGSENVELASATYDTDRIYHCNNYGAFFEREV